jgi:hypothetical protein
MVVWMPRPMVS